VGKNGRGLGISNLSATKRDDQDRKKEKTQSNRVKHRRSLCVKGWLLEKDFSRATNDLPTAKITQKCQKNKKKTENRSLIVSEKA